VFGFCRDNIGFLRLSAPTEGVLFLICVLGNYIIFVCFSYGNIFTKSME